MLRTFLLFSIRTRSQTMDLQDEPTSGTNLDHFTPIRPGPACVKYQYVPCVYTLRWQGRIQDFPLGEGPQPSLGGSPTSNVGAFWQKIM